MENITKFEASLILFVILFIIVFVFDYLFIKRRYLKRINGKKKVKKNKELTEVAYLVGKFKLDKTKLPLNILCFIFSLINAFIIALVSVVVILCNTYYILELIIGFILLIALIYAIYELLGRYLKKRGFDKNGK